MTRLVQDRKLLDEFRRGERSALAEVYREYVRPLYALISEGFTFESGGAQRRFAGYRDPWVVENAVQETFARAFASATRQAYDGLRPYRNYLFTIARNLIIDALRAGAREVPCDEPAAVEVDPASTPIDEELLSQELAGHCAAFVASLEAGERALFEARFRRGLSVEEAARQLGISQHHVKRGERRLKKRFFLRMKQLGYFEGYRLGAIGIEKVALLLVLFAGSRP